MHNAQSQLFDDDTVGPKPHPAKGLTVRGKSVAGMADFPGSGPDGETCGTCRHRLRVRHHDYYYQKCAMKESHWTHGAGSDIKIYFPACSQWQPAE